MISEPAYRDALAAVGASLPERRDDTPLALLYEADPERFAQTLENAEFRLALARSYIGLGAPVLALGDAHIFLDGSTRGIPISAST